MEENRLVSLIIRQLSGQLSTEEVEELETWASELPVNQRLLNLVKNEEELEDELNKWKRIDPVLGYDKWLFQQQARPKTRILRIASWSVAASLLIAVAIGGLIWKSRPNVQPNVVATKVPQQVLPGRNMAVLTLSSGQAIQLDSTGKGELAIQDGVRIVKPNDGSLSYQASGKDNFTTVAYNTLTTPKSGQYQITLCDGSRVWLNNVSSLRYPTSFQGRNRTVELTGEAYFEIAKEPTKPFFVKVKDQSIEVLGTSFNVMAYAEEGGTQTTLLDGAVRIKGNATAVQLRPNEQARSTLTGGIKILYDVPAGDIVSWKNGFFYFGRASFASVMRQLSRWYDVDVVYEGKEPEMEFGGKIDRSLSLNELLRYLDKNQIHFRLEGRKLIVLPN